MAENVVAKAETEETMQPLFGENGEILEDDFKNDEDMGEVPEGVE